MEKQVFNEKMEAVAGLLGLGWQKDDTWANHGYLVRTWPDQFKISARNDDYSNKGRIKFSSVYPRGNTGYGASSSRDHIEITIAETKTPERIAKDIQGRFLPIYLENLEKVIEANQQADEYEARKLATIKKVADYIGDGYHPTSDDSVIYPAMKEIYKIKSSGSGYVELEIRNCTPEKCIEIIEILRKP